MAGIIAAPVVLSGCGRGKSQPVAIQKPAPTVEETDLDDVDDSVASRPPLPVSEPIIRVRVMKVRPPSNAAGSSLLIGAEGQWIKLQRENGPANGVAMSGPLRVSMEAGAGENRGGWSITDGLGFRAATDGRETIQLRAMDDETNSMLSVREISADRGAASKPGDERLYPGTLRLFSRHDLQRQASRDQGIKASSATPLDASMPHPSMPALGAFDLINGVPLELYLPGVLAGELYKSWQPETFAAQAVAARSFACTEAAVFANRRHYDVANSIASQMYLGSGPASGVHQKAIDAVKLTRGLFLSYESLVVSGYYSSCCGGAAASATDAFGSNPVNDAPPLQGRSGTTDACAGCQVYQWKVEHPIDALTRRLIAFGQDKKYKDLSNLTRAGGGSNSATLASIEVIAVNANGRPTRMRITDSAQNIAELTAENFRRAANWSGGENSNPPLSPPLPLPPPEKPLKSSNLKATFAGNVVTFEGFGFGHGAGMCQYGAESLAKSGQDHRAILAWYYPGVELVRAYV